MEVDVWTFLTGVFAQLIRFFNSFYLPGTRVTPLSLILLSSFVSFFIAFVRKLTNQDSNIKGITKHFRSKE